jgi:cytochrome b subunit of formate dehydrogenase
MTNKIRRVVSFARENRYFIIAVAFLLIAVLGLAVAFTSMDYGVKDLTPLARTLMSFIGLAVAAAATFGAKMVHWRIEDQLAEERRRALRW